MNTDAQYVRFIFKESLENKSSWINLFCNDLIVSHTEYFPDKLLERQYIIFKISLVS
jgi:hypothetical protein